MKKFLIIFLFFSLFALSGCTSNIGQITPVDNIPVATSTLESSSTPIEPVSLDVIAPDEKINGTCQENGGIWLNEYRECESVSLKWCEKHNGVFDGCGSACRHQATSTTCITECVPVCALLASQPATSTPVVEVNDSAPEVCTPCRLYSNPAPGWCPNGKIVAPEKDSCGCLGHPICEQN